MSKIAEDLSGQTLDKLFFKSQYRNPTDGKLYYNSVCECGKDIVVLATGIRYKVNLSCGCGVKRKSSKSVTSPTSLISEQSNIVRTLSDRLEAVFEMLPKLYRDRVHDIYKRIPFQGHSRVDITSTEDQCVITITRLKKELVISK